jgi:hypothetical protein
LTAECDEVREKWDGLATLGSQLMEPALVREFIAAVNTEWAGLGAQIAA